MIRPRDVRGAVSVLTPGIAQINIFVGNSSALVRCRFVVYYGRVRTDATNGVKTITFVEGAAHHPPSSNNFVACLALVDLRGH